MSDKTLKISPPWYTFRNKVASLFALDSQVEVGELEETQQGTLALNIKVRNHKKFVALDRVLPPKVNFGNVTLILYLFDLENVEGSEPSIEIFKNIFEGNPVVRDVREVVDTAGVHHGFVRFEPEVIQFYNDDLTDFNGNWNGLGEDIARELFYTNWNVQFCTAAKDEAFAKRPQGEWKPEETE